MVFVPPIYLMQLLQRESIMWIDPTCNLIKISLTENQIAFAIYIHRNIHKHVPNKYKKQLKKKTQSREHIRSSFNLFWSWWFTLTKIFTQQHTNAYTHTQWINVFSTRFYLYLLDSPLYLFESRFSRATHHCYTVCIKWMTIRMLLQKCVYILFGNYHVHYNIFLHHIVWTQTLFHFHITEF